MNASRDACSSPTNVTDLLSDLSVTTAREEGSVFEEDPDTAPLSVCSSPTNVLDLEDNATFVTRPSLKQLFDDIDQPIADAGHICQLIRPFVINAIAQDSESLILHEILAFLDHILVEPCASGWSCSNGQVHAIDTTLVFKVFDYRIFTFYDVSFQRFRLTYSIYGWLSHNPTFKKVV